MKSGKPWSHIVSIGLFVLMAVAFIATVLSQIKKGGNGALVQAIFAVPYVIAVVALLQSPARWAYYFCAILLFVFPAFIVVADIAILLKVGSSSSASVVPSLAGCALFLLLFYWFTFGPASRRFYGFNAA